MAVYRVVWRNKATKDLAAIWIVSADKTAIAQAQASADRWLAADPHRYGQPLAEGLWAITVTPLRISFELDEVNSLVIVTDVNRVA